MLSVRFLLALIVFMFIAYVAKSGWGWLNDLPWTWIIVLSIMAYLNKNYWSKGD